MSSKNRKYVVSVATTNGGIQETIDEQTPNRAVHTAQKIYPGSVILEVSTKWEFIGVCRKCRAVVLDNENFKQFKDETIECEGCKN